jgi:hypothetical protein
MTSAIKPPGSGGSVAGLTPTPTEPSGVTAARPSEAPAAAVAAGPTGLVEQLKSGAISAGQVIDTVVANALAEARAQGLPAEDQADLERVLRLAVETDPTLAALARDLDR